MKANNNFFVIVVIAFICAVFNFSSATAQVKKTRYIPISGDINYYVGARAGVNHDMNAQAGGVVGLRWNAFRLEVEGMWSEKNPQLMGLINVDLIKARVIPFLTIGAGAGKQTSGIQLIESPGSATELDGVHIKRNFNFQWTAGAGVSFRIIDHVQMEIAYRCTGFPSESKFMNNKETILKDMNQGIVDAVNVEKLLKINHELRIGIRYHF